MSLTRPPTAAPLLKPGTAVAAHVREPATKEAVVLAVSAPVDRTVAGIIAGISQGGWSDGGEGSEDDGQLHLDGRGENDGTNLWYLCFQSCACVSWDVILFSACWLDRCGICERQ